MICFKKVREAYGWMSNMSPHPIGEFRTAEALFQALRFKDPEVIAAIKAQKSPMGAKMVAKKNADKMVVTPRSELDIRNMRIILGMKMGLYPELRDQLLATGEEEIIEDVTSRPNESGLFWGKIPNGAGTNTLGKLWMELRALVRADDPEQGAFDAADIGRVFSTAFDWPNKGIEGVDSPKKAD